MAVTILIFYSFLIACVGIVLIISGLTLFKKRKVIKIIGITIGTLFIIPFSFALFIIISGSISDKVRDINAKGPLFLTIENGNLIKVKELIPDKYNVNFINTNYADHSPLTFAVKSRRYQIMNFLIENGADINYKDKNGYTALMYASSETNQELAVKTVQYLISNGAEVNINGKPYEPTALHIAVEGKNIKLVMLLINNKADINKKSTFGYTPLHIASRLRDIQLIKLLLENNADINVLDSYQESPFFIICDYFNYYDTPRFFPEVSDIFYLMMKYNPDLNTTNVWGNTQLDILQNTKYTNYINILIKKGAKKGKGIKRRN